MKKLLLLLSGVFSLSVWTWAEEPAPPPAREPLTVAQIEELVAPIALYPDPLVAIILPAATQPADIVLAARYLERGGELEAVDAEPWDDSVKALARYREVIDYLDENLEWTRTLGEAFLDQREQVMTAVQTLRTRARANGLLSSTAEQDVLVEADDIRIVPAQPTVIYVPRYDPEVLYVTHVNTFWPRPFLTFGIGYSIGWWLSFDCDWRYRTVHVVHRPAQWYYRPDWRIRYSHRHPHPDYRWTHWQPRHPRPPHHHARPVGPVVLRPNRDWEAARQARLQAQPSRGGDERRRPDRGVRPDSPSPRHQPGQVNPRAGQDRPRGPALRPGTPAPEVGRETRTPPPRVNPAATPGPRVPRVEGADNRRHQGPRTGQPAAANNSGPAVGNPGRANNPPPARDSGRVVNPPRSDNPAPRVSAPPAPPAERPRAQPERTPRTERNTRDADADADASPRRTQRQLN